jgi:polysaccharide biosynthesis protein PslH
MHALISRLSRAHEVTVLSFVAEGREPQAVDATRQICSRVVAVCNPAAAATGAAKRRLQARSIASASSFARRTLRTRAMQDAIDALTHETTFDLTLVEFSQMAGYRFPTTGPVVLDEHNIEYDILGRTFASERHVVRKLFSYLEHLKLKAEERAAWGRIDACVFTSDRDHDIAHETERGVPMSVVPNGVDVVEFAPTETACGKDIVFVGADFYPNADAVRFYADEVFPQVLRAEPATRLLVVGGTALALSDRQRRGVVLIGAVDDVRPYVGRAAVVIAPLRIGGGTRLKILEAMAMARPVVATRIGAEGIDAVPGRDLLIADDADGLARSTLQLLADPRLACEIGKAGRALVERRYDWDVLARDLDRFIRTLLAPRRAYRLRLVGKGWVDHGRT